MTEGHDGRQDLRHGQHQEVSEGGDPVCWLDRVCDECGAMREDVRAAHCARCGTPFHGAGTDRGGAPA